MTLGNDKKVYIIYSNEYTEEEILADLESEGYPYPFHIKHQLESLKAADEVWIFGNCNGYPETIMALELGKDIWQMG